MSQVYGVVKDLIQQLEATETAAIESAAEVFADAIMAGGIIQAYGSGHSTAGALEITHRAGGFIPTKNIKEPAGGIYESIEGVGATFLKKVDIREEDAVVIISNSGRNPFPIEMAIGAKAKGAKVIAVTAVEASKGLTSKHSSGKNLYQVADVVLDNKVVSGDSTIDVEGLDTKICGMSTVTTSILLQAVTLRAAEIMLERGFQPPIYKSQNIDGGREYNDALEEKYYHRLYRI